MKIPLILFTLMSISDVVLTTILLTKGIGYESNPVAHAFIDQFGLAYIGIYKLVTAIPLLAVCFVADNKSAAKVLWLGCFLTAGVLGWSIFILLHY